MISLPIRGVLSLFPGQNGPPDGDGAQAVFDAWADSGAQDPMFGKVIMALLAVLALIMLTFYLIKRFFPMRGASLGRSRLKVLDTLPLGGKRWIQVIKVYGRNLVIGVTHERIELLTELSEEELPPFETQAPKEKRERSRILHFRSDKPGMCKVEGKDVEA